MRRLRPHRWYRRPNYAATGRTPTAGFLLIDACIALVLAALLATAAAALSARVGATRSVLEPDLQARAAGAAAMAWIGDQVRQSGALLPPDTVDSLHPMAAPFQPLLTAEANGAAGERLVIRHESRTDCLGASRVAGRPYADPLRDPPVVTQTNVIYVSRTATGGPSLMCDPDAAGSATPQAFASGIEALHLRFRHRGNAGWLNTNGVADWSGVIAVEVCLVLSGGSSSACPSVGGMTTPSARRLLSVFALRNAF